LILSLNGIGPDGAKHLADVLEMNTVYSFCWVFHNLYFSTNRH